MQGRRREDSHYFPLLIFFSSIYIYIYTSRTITPLWTLYWWSFPSRSIYRRYDNEHWSNFSRRVEQKRSGKNFRIYPLNPEGFVIRLFFSYVWFVLRIGNERIGKRDRSLRNSIPRLDDSRITNSILPLDPSLFDSPLKNETGIARPVRFR